MGRESLLARTFVDLVAQLVQSEDVDEFLRTFADRCAALVDAEAVGIMLTGQSGTLRLASASTDDMHALEAFEVQSEEGPCFDAFEGGHQVIERELSAPEAAQRWPSFTPRARALGLEAVHAFPLEAQDQRMGALNVFYATAGSFDEDDIVMLQSLADVASLSLVQYAERRRADKLTDQLQTALDSRVLIEQAKGILCSDASISVQEAFQAIRSRARESQRPLREVAEHVVENRELPPRRSLPPTGTAGE